MEDQGQFATDGWASAEVSDKGTMYCSHGRSSLRRGAGCLRSHSGSGQDSEVTVPVVPTSVADLGRRDIFLDGLGGEARQASSKLGLRELAWKQRGGIGGVDRSTHGGGVEGATRSFWAEGRHRADKDWMTGMARAAVRMGTWRLDTQG